MTRRTIVVEGTTYKWQRAADGMSVVVFPPKGGGGPVKLSLDQDGDDDDPYRDTSPTVTPGIVADLIHRRILERPAPVREHRPVRPVRSVRPRAVRPHWVTSTEVPRIHAVMCTLHAEGGVPTVFAVEAHVEAATAIAAAAELSRTSEEIREHYRLLVGWDRSGRRWSKPEFRARRGGVNSAFPGLSAWMDATLENGHPSLVKASFAVMQVPLQVPAPSPTRERDRLAWLHGMDRTAGTLSRMHVPRPVTA